MDKSIREQNKKQNTSCYRTHATGQKHMQRTKADCGQREIFGSGRFGGLWLVPTGPKTGRGRPSSKLSGTKSAAAAFAILIAAPTRTCMRKNEEPTCATKESDDASAES